MCPYRAVPYSPSPTPSSKSPPFIPFYCSGRVLVHLDSLSFLLASTALKSLNKSQDILHAHYPQVNPTYSFFQALNFWGRFARYIYRTFSLSKFCQASIAAISCLDNFGSTTARSRTRQPSQPELPLVEARLPILLTNFILFVQHQVRGYAS
jgi:hypothetical protein